MVKKKKLEQAEIAAVVGTLNDVTDSFREFDRLISNGHLNYDSMHSAKDIVHALVCGARDLNNFALRMLVVADMYETKAKTAAMVKDAKALH